MGELAIVTIAAVAILTPGLAKLSLELVQAMLLLLPALSDLLSDLVLLAVAHLFGWAHDSGVE